MYIEKCTDRFCIGHSRDAVGLCIEHADIKHQDELRDMDAKDKALWAILHSAYGGKVICVYANPDIKEWISSASKYNSESYVNMRTEYYGRLRGMDWAVYAIDDSSTQYDDTGRCRGGYHMGYKKDDAPYIVHDKYAYRDKYQGDCVWRARTSR